MTEARSTPPVKAPQTPGPLQQREAQEHAVHGLGLFAMLRQLERQAHGKPRIGRNARLRDTIVRLGQDPFLAFPATDLARVDLDKRPPIIRAQFLGFFGAFGAFPLNWTEEVRRWFETGDESFVAFTDIFAARFQELYFRAWSDAQAITQYDHPQDDRFQTYLMAVLGTASGAYRGRDGMDDTARLRLAPLAMGRVKSPVRLQQMLQVHFGNDIVIAVDEMIPTWLEFEPDALCRLGAQSSTLGRDLHLGNRVRSIAEKFHLHIRVPDFAAYQRFLPGGADHDALRDLVFWYLGQRFEIEVLLWLPVPEVRPAILGQSTQLGWMACVAPDYDNPDHRINATRFRLRPARAGAEMEVTRPAAA
jgi:type VI secretion system protein ImpH